MDLQSCANREGTCRIQREASISVSRFPWFPIQDGQEFPQNRSAFSLVGSHSFSSSGTLPSHYTEIWRSIHANECCLWSGPESSSSSTNPDWFWHSPWTSCQPRSRFSTFELRPHFLLRWCSISWTRCIDHRWRGFWSWPSIIYGDHTGTPSNGIPSYTWSSNFLYQSSSKSYCE